MLFKLFVCFVGIFVSYLLNGVAIETVTTLFGKKIFTFYLFMVLVPGMFNTLFAKLALGFKIYFKDQNEQVTDHDSNIIPKKLYFLCSIFHMCSMLSSNASLAHINYPTQLILKSSKPIPVLLCGFVIMKKKYTVFRFVSTIVIVVGVMTFMYEQYLLNRNPSVSLAPNDTNNATPSYVYGWSLVFLSLSFDGLLATTQERMRQDYDLDAHKLMYYINAYSSVLLAFAVVTFNELPGFFKFASQQKRIFVYLFLLGFTSAVGQNFIYYTITNFGPLTCSIITTTRKFFNVLLSVVLFSHVMSIKLWMSVFVVAIGLVLDIWSQCRNEPVILPH